MNRVPVSQERPTAKGYQCLQCIHTKAFVDCLSGVDNKIQKNVFPSKEKLLRIRVNEI